MVGYSGYSTNYRLFDLDTRKVTISRDVTFNENFDSFEKRSTSRYALLEWPILQNNEEAEGAQPAERNEVTAETEDAKIEQKKQREHNLQNETKL
ncbi:hypothetical protein QE152_g18935 [Popillia japonica]|uniref:Retroviral polymerase SH3-like domain-containing protein n=1 Tax=Popillia japonica TaxID=7064 RepID=A0AAW1L5A8_POPJA